ncbi:MAG: hypothetical protein QXG52_09085 [Candidatus Caldarchaeum sp.]
MKESEPCPFCGRRITPIHDYLGGKKCPCCGGRWFESGAGRRPSQHGGAGGGDSAGEALAV